jgi:hypothetical protein
VLFLRWSACVAQGILSWTTPTALHAHALSIHVLLQCSHKLDSFFAHSKTHNKGLWMYMENKDNGEKFSNADTKQWNEARKKSHPEAK